MFLSGHFYHSVNTRPARACSVSEIKSVFKVKEFVDDSYMKLFHTQMFQGSHFEFYKGNNGLCNESITTKLEVYFGLPIKMKNIKTHAFHGATFTVMRPTDDLTKNDDICR